MVENSKPELPKFKLPKPRRRQRNRRRPDPAMAPGPPLAAVLSVTASGDSEVTIVFDGFVMISAKRLPATWIFGTANRTITSLISATPMVYVLALSGPVAAAEAYSIPAMDPAARTRTGGYVGAKNGTLG